MTTFAVSIVKRMAGLIFAVTLLNACNSQEIKQHYSDKHTAEIEKNYTKILATKGVSITRENLLTTAALPNGETVYFFTQAGHPMHPTQVVSKKFDSEMYWGWISLSERPAFDEWLKSFFVKRGDYNMPTNCPVVKKKKICGSFEPVTDNNGEYTFLSKNYIDANMELNLTCDCL